MKFDPSYSKDVNRKHINIFLVRSNPCLVWVKYAHSFYRDISAKGCVLTEEIFVSITGITQPYFITDYSRLQHRIWMWEGLERSGGVRSEVRVKSLWDARARMCTLRCVGSFGKI